MKPTSSDDRSQTLVSNTSDFLFTLQKIGNKNPAKIVSCQFKPITNVSSQGTISNINFADLQLQSIPTFNNDKKPHTPSFMLPIQKKHFLDNDAQHQQNLNRKIKQTDIQQQFKPIFIPKPSSKNFYCANCKKVYGDYLQHVASKQHKKIVHNHPINKNIQQLCSEFTHQKSSKKMRRPQIVQNLNQNPRKKIKQCILFELQKKQSQNTTITTLNEQLPQMYEIKVQN